MVARTRQILEEKGEQKARIPLALTRLYMAESFDEVRTIARRLVNNASPDESRERNVGIVDDYIRFLSTDTHELCEEIAAHVVDRERYSLD
jgi:hypothetical protein